MHVARLILQIEASSDFLSLKVDPRIGSRPRFFAKRLQNLKYRGALAVE